MTKVKDFKEGTIGYIYDYGYSTDGHRKQEIHKTTIQKVGRKYVTCDHIRFEQDECEFGLRSETWSGKRLFLTQEDAVKHIEKNALCRWLHDTCYHLFKLEKYSLEQLRQVKQILEPDS